MSGAADTVLPADRLAEALPESDFVVLCCPLNDTTTGLVGAAELSLMKPVWAIPVHDRRSSDRRSFSN